MPPRRLKVLLQLLLLLLLLLMLLLVSSRVNGPLLMNWMIIRMHHAIRMIGRRRMGPMRRLVLTMRRISVHDWIVVDFWSVSYLARPASKR